MSSAPFVEAAEQLPERLREALDVPLPPSEWLREGTVVTTGVGLSGGPARLLALRLAARGLPARFVPLSQWSRGAQETAAKPALLVLFSQGLSANARLASAVPAARKVAFTGVSSSARDEPAQALRRLLGRNGWAVSVPSVERHEHLVRLQSPTVAAFQALRWQAELDRTPAEGEAIELGPRRAEEAFARARRGPRPKPEDGPLIFVTEGRPPEEFHHLAMKWTEATFSGPPPVLDVLELAHGPLQAFFNEKRCVVAFGKAGPSTLFERLGQVLDGARHRLIRVEAEGPAPLDLVEYDSVLNGWLVEGLAAGPGPWPGKGRDAPLYAWAGDH